MSYRIPPQLILLFVAIDPVDNDHHLTLSIVRTVSENINMKTVMFVTFGMFGTVVSLSEDIESW